MKRPVKSDFIIIGSGFGGAFLAERLARQGREVLIIERGRWVTRDDSCWDEVRLHLKDHLYRGRTPIYADQRDGKTFTDWPDDTVGGMSTFYGAAAFRLREADFQGPPLPDSSVRDSRYAWPFGYGALKKYYDMAEKLQGIAGVRGTDITEPSPAAEYPHSTPDALARPCRLVADAARSLGLHPFHIPMAINFSGKFGKEKCILCPTCDHYLCKIEAKNDLSVNMIPSALKHGAKILDETRVVKININRGRAESVDLIDQRNGERYTVKAKNIIVSAGALNTPHLLLSSGIESHTAAGHNIGRRLMRHSNGIVAGLFKNKSNPDQILQKRIAIPDYYHGSLPGMDEKPEGPWGIIQDVSSIGKGVIKANAPTGLKNIAAFFSDYLINQLCIAEDIPQYDNRVFADSTEKDIFGMPALKVYHRYHQRDIQARDALYRAAKRILRKAGALVFYTMPIETFSHALGTCRMGSSAELSVVNPECGIWGIKNLHICDGSVLSSGGSVNPSLTIAALSLRLSDTFK
jgi:choline dehydrogenase-like flavoprotein